jgi:uncharacterized repeat protein (TIGR03833 family)
MKFENIGMSKTMNKTAPNRRNIHPGDTVDIIQKLDQRTGKLTRGVVKDVLTNSPSHPHGIKVRLQTGLVGRVQVIIKATKWQIWLILKRKNERADDLPSLIMMKLHLSFLPFWQVHIFGILTQSSGKA